MVDESISDKQKRLFAAFEEMGESEVIIRHTPAPGFSGSQDVPFAQAWLRLKQQERDASAASKRDEREERTLAISEEALSIAKEANRIASEDLEAARLSASSAGEQARWAKWAAILAAIAAITANWEAILSIIFGNS